MNRPGDIKSVYRQGFAKSSNLAGNPRLEKVLQILHESGMSLPHRVLDVGCGDGGFVKTIGHVLGAEELYGIDIAEGAIQIAMSSGIQAQCIDLDEVDLPYQDGFFDLIYCGHLVELVLNVDHLIKEMRRVLSSHGSMVITHPNLGAWASRVAVAFGRLPFYGRVSTEYDLGKLLTAPYPGHSTGFIRLFTTHAFRQFLGLHGLRVEKVWGVGEASMPGALRIIDGVLSRFPSLAFHDIWLVKHPP